MEKDIKEMTDREIQERQLRMQEWQLGHLQKISSRLYWILGIIVFLIICQIVSCATSPSFNYMMNHTQ
jgi:hypothetical protein